MAGKTHEMDLTTGSIFGKLIRFAIPLILMNMLQLLFNATDIAILGIFVSDMAVGAVGANTTLIHLIVNLFIGFSVGTNVVLSKCVGSGNKEKARKVVGTSVLMSLIIGTALVFVGFFGAETFLTWMDCDPILIEDAALYLKIYFLGMPIIMLYNFLAAIMRAVGDTTRPMLFLLIAGVVNVGLNIFFILVFDMTVDGVAIATVTSQAISAVLSLIVIVRSKGYGKLKFSCLRIYKNEFVDIIKVGLPSGLQSAMFSISNVLIQATVNSFGAAATTGNSVASQFDAIVYTVGNSLALACMSFVSQNYGAGKMNRVKEVIIKTFILIFVLELSVGIIVILLSDPLCRIMTSSPDVLRFAKERLIFLSSIYFFCGFMDALSYALRSLGKSTTAMIISLCCVCVFRVLWLNTAYLLNPTFLMIFISYPISWVLSIIVDFAVLIPTMKKINVKLKNEQPKTEELAETA